MMEHYSKRKPLLVFLILSCLLLPLAASVPLSRSLSLRNHQDSPGLEVAAQDVMTMEERNLSRATARMDIEVDDYPGSGANNRHDPKSPGRA